MSPFYPVTCMSIALLVKSTGNPFSINRQVAKGIPLIWTCRLQDILQSEKISSVHEWPLQRGQFLNCFWLQSLQGCFSLEKTKKI